MLFALHVVHGMHKKHFQAGEWELFAGLTPTKREYVTVVHLIFLVGQGTIEWQLSPT